LPFILTLPWQDAQEGSFLVEIFVDPALAAGGELALAASAGAAGSAGPASSPAAVSLAADEAEDELSLAFDGASAGFSPPPQETCPSKRGSEAAPARRRAAMD